MVEPKYQRCGLGTWLSEHCDAIADEARITTFVIPRYTSLKLFRSTGYKKLGTETYDLSPFGGPGEERMDIYMREPGQGENLS